MTFIADTVFKGFSGGAPAATEEEQDIFLFPLDPALSTASQLSLYSPGNGLSWLKGLHTFNRRTPTCTRAWAHARAPLAHKQTHSHKYPTHLMHSCFSLSPASIGNDQFQSEYTLEEWRTLWELNLSIKGAAQMEMGKG